MFTKYIRTLKSCTAHRTMADQQDARILRLPLELRDLICRLILDGTISNIDG